MVNKSDKNIYKKLAKMWVIVRSELTIEESDKKYIIFEKDDIDTEKKIEKTIDIVKVKKILYNDRNKIVIQDFLVKEGMIDARYQGRRSLQGDRSRRPHL